MITLTFVESVSDAIGALGADADQYPDNVRRWMRFMALVYFSGVFFIKRWVDARWVVLVIASTAIGLVVAKMIFPETPRDVAGTMIHLLFWLPLVLYLFVVHFKPAVDDIKAPPLYTKVHGLWLMLVMILLSVSLIFDARVTLGWLS